MSIRQLATPCWTLDNPHSWPEDHPGAGLHFNNLAAAVQDATELTGDSPAGTVADLTAVKEPAPCWEIRCDECGIATTNSEERDHTEHYPSRDAVLDAVADWRTDRAGNPSLCAECAAVADCVEYGHTYSDWYLCRCGGHHPWHSDGCPQFRYCQRCGEGDDPAYPETPTAGRDADVAVAS